MKRVELRYFGLIAEQIGRDSEVRETQLGTIAEIRQELEREFFMLQNLPYRIARNKKLVDDASVIEHGDELAFMPPFAGG